jgi:excisionase family DNA binding protein
LRKGRVIFYETYEIAERLERTPTRVRQLIADGEIPAVRIGGRFASAR